jgi:acylphosphatase
VRGYVRNMPDGTVELDIIGSKDIVEAALAEAQEGSPFSTVERIESHEMQGDNGYCEFVIER